MKIFSSEQIREIEKLSIKAEQITSIDLMERAATQLFNLLHQRLQGAQIPIHVFCGLGNNGGDGLVVSRLLVEHGYNVKTYIVNFSDNRSKDFLVNYDRLKSITNDWPIQLKSADDLPEINRDDMMIDAIFGIGLNRPIVAWVVELIKHINASRCFTLSIDVPSGLRDDKGPDDPEGVIYASTTITFQVPKIMFFLPETGKYVQDLEVIDIGLNREALAKSPAIAELVGKNEVRNLYRPRQKYGHKGNYGHSVIIGGSYGKIGAVALATKAALRTGAGLVTAYTPKCGYTILQSTVPESMVVTDNNDNKISNIEIGFEASAIAIGMGMGTDSDTITAFETFIKSNKSPLVIDADAINILSKQTELLQYLPALSILTPHLGELRRLIGDWKDDFDRIHKVKQFSTEHNCIVVVKGANSMIVYKNQVYINTTGNPGMATAGSGDALSGMIASLIGQGYEPLLATILGVYLHGSAGDLATVEHAYQGLIASDIVDTIGKAYLELFKNTNEGMQQSKGQESQN